MKERAQLNLVRFVACRSTKMEVSGSPMFHLITSSIQKPDVSKHTTSSYLVA
jgi:hypothetical protein